MSPGHPLDMQSGHHPVLLDQILWRWDQRPVPKQALQVAAMQEDVWGPPLWCILADPALNEHFPLGKAGVFQRDPSTGQKSFAKFLNYSFLQRSIHSIIPLYVRVSKLQKDQEHRWQTQGPQAESALYPVSSGPAPCFYPAAEPSSSLAVKE